MNNSFNRFVSYFFFSNIFLGISAVSLCIETNLMTHLSLNYFPFYIITFLGTSIYYTIIYVKNVQAKHHNERTLWYRRNLGYILTTLKYIVAIAIFFGMVILFRNRHSLFSLTPLQWVLLIIFPCLAIWYTISPRIFPLKNIREIGMVKPFIIGLTWSGFVTFYPVFIWQIQKGFPGTPPLFPSVFLWLQNFLFISILAIIFDIKDYRNDLLHYLKTFPVVLGIKNTLRFVTFPLLILNIFAFAAFQMQQHFSLEQTFLQAIPYLFLTFVIFKHNKPKKLLYYLAGIDGLMLLKAVCGITSIIIK